VRNELVGDGSVGLCNHKCTSWDNEREDEVENDNTKNAKKKRNENRIRTEKKKIIFLYVLSGHVLFLSRKPSHSMIIISF
jgi:hypothetical protein